MIYVFLTNNIVTDVARVPPSSIFNWSYAQQFVEAPDEVTHGWAFNGTSWTPPPAPPPPGPPTVVRMRQARQALLQAGKLEAVEQAIAALPEPARKAAQIDWEFAAEVQRSWPLVQTLAQALGMTEADLDALFTAAAAL